MTYGNLARPYPEQLDKANAQIAALEREVAYLQKVVAELKAERDRIGQESGK